MRHDSNKLLKFMFVFGFFQLNATVLFVMLKIDNAVIETILFAVFLANLFYIAICYFVFKFIIRPMNEIKQQLKDDSEEE